MARKRGTAMGFGRGVLLALVLVLPGCSDEGARQRAEAEKSSWLKDMHAALGESVTDFSVLVESGSMAMSERQYGAAAQSFASAKDSARDAAGRIGILRDAPGDYEALDNALDDYFSVAVEFAGYAYECASFYYERNTTPEDGYTLDCDRTTAAALQLQDAEDNLLKELEMVRQAELES